MKEYALYKGEDILDIGTIREIAKQQGVREDTIRFYGTRAYQRRLEKRKNSRNAKVLISLEDDEEEKDLSSGN